MNDIKDAWGHAYLNYYNGKPSFLVFERDDGFVNISPTAKDYFLSYKDWDVHEREAIKYAKDRCLDVGCGAGRAELYLQSKGFDSLGIDESPMAIKVCKLRGVKSARVLSHKRIRDLKGPFSTVLL